jgi:hypothetical protein
MAFKQVQSWCFSQACTLPLLLLLLLLLLLVFRCVYRAAGCCAQVAWWC